MLPPSKPRVCRLSHQQPLDSEPSNDAPSHVARGGLVESVHCSSPDEGGPSIPQSTEGGFHGQQRKVGGGWNGGAAGGQCCLLKYASVFFCCLSSRVRGRFISDSTATIDQCQMQVASKC